jgi:hypothetical protein
MMVSRARNSKRAAGFRYLKENQTLSLTVILAYALLCLAAEMVNT